MQRFRQLAQVHAGTKDFADGGQDHAASGVIVARSLKDRVQLGDQRTAQSIVLVGAIDGDERDARLHFIQGPRRLRHDMLHGVCWYRTISTAG